jgi:uncharacterized protein YaiL (DUF2058 family)
MPISLPQEGGAMQSLRDQLSKAGIITKEQKRQVEQEKRRERKQHKPGRVEEKRQEQQRQAYEARLQAQRQADQQRAAEQHAQLAAREKRLQIRHIIEHWATPTEPYGTQRWYFTTRQNTIKYLYVTEPIAAQLSSGALAIAEHPDTLDTPHVLVDREAAELIRHVDPQYIRFHNADPSDDHKEM